MTFNHMSEEFKDKQRQNLAAKKAAGFSAQQALRDLEIDCGRSNEEFAVDGIPLVEEVFDGVFGGGQGGSFEPNKHDAAPLSESAPEPLPAATPEPLPAEVAEPEVVAAAEEMPKAEEPAEVETAHEEQP